MAFLEKNTGLKEIVLDEGQKNILTQLEKKIEFPSNNIIGLEGEWGSGKSTILNALCEAKDENGEKKYRCYEYDLWAHQEDNLRYSFLRGMLENFENEFKSLKNKKESYKQLKADIDDLISNRKESSPSINLKMVGLIFIMLFLPLFGDIAGVLWDSKKIVYVIASFFFPIAGVSLLYLYNKKNDVCENEECEKRRKNYSWLFVVVFMLVVSAIVDFAYGIDLDRKIEFNWIKLIVYIVQGGCCVFIAFFIINMFRNISRYAKNSFVKDALSLYNDKFVETSYSTDIQPRMEGVRTYMENFFRKMLELNDKKMVILFDNLDRLPPEKIRAFWTFLQTFFVGKRFDSVTTIIAYERKSVVNAWKTDYYGNEVGEGYLAKSLDYNIYVRLYSRMELKKFFEDAFRLAFDDCVCKRSVINNIFNIYYVLKQNDPCFSSRRSIIDTVNEIKLNMDNYDLLFQEKSVSNFDLKIKYPFELVAMYVLKRNYINEIFSNIVKKGIVKYYIEVFENCLDWVEQYIPGDKFDEKKMNLQLIYDKMIQEYNDCGRNMLSYYTIEYVCDGLLESYCEDKLMRPVRNNCRNDFDFIFTMAIQQIEDDCATIENIVEALLYCQRKKMSSPANIKNKWGVLLTKIEQQAKWSKRTWFLNAVLFNARNYLNWKADEFPIIQNTRESAMIKKIQAYYGAKQRNIRGKICISERYLKDYIYDAECLKSPHNMKENGKIFFYENDVNEDDTIVVEQLNNFGLDDWMESLRNFWNPGVIQYYKLRDKSKCCLDMLQSAEKYFFESKVLWGPRSYEKGPCNDNDYYKVWLELIKVLDQETLVKLKSKFLFFFPERFQSDLMKLFNN